MPTLRPGPVVVLPCPSRVRRRPAGEARVPAALRLDRRSGQDHGGKGVTMREPEKVTREMVEEAYDGNGTRERLERQALMRYVQGINSYDISGYNQFNTALDEIKLVLLKLIERG